jgi:hypothetical protein
MHPKSLFLEFKALLPEKKFRIIFYVLTFYLVKELLFIASFNGGVSKIADGYSEANSIRGGHYFAENGLTEYSGLPDLCYGELHPNHGFKGAYKKKGEECKKSVYTHYPPGSEYLVTPFAKIFGAHNTYVLRLQPIFFNFLVSIIFILTLFKVYGLQAGYWIALISILPQMFHNYWHGLHHQGYAFSFLLLQMSLIFRVWTSDKKTSLASFAGLYILGFLQGWMTFDYAFLVSFVALPFYFLLREQHGVKLIHFIMSGFFSGLGFTTSHLLHFWQVVNYYGSFDQAYEDLFHSAKYRANNLGKTNAKITNLKEIKGLNVLKDFMWNTAGRFKYTSVNLINYVWIILTLKFIKRVQIKKSGNIYEFNITVSDLLAVFSAVFVAGGWSIVMRQHAWIHGFIARHYYLVFFICTTVFFSKLKKVEQIG